MSWESVIGQDRAKTILRSSISHDRVSHAYLFSGPEGVGKDAMAIEFAKTLNCDRRSDESCGGCVSCSRISMLQHPNVRFVHALPVGKNETAGDPPLLRLTESDLSLVRDEIAKKSANPYHQLSIPRATNIKINSVREIRRESALALASTGKRVFIFSGAEDMSDEAANSLLKTLEEPHEDTILVLTTSHPDQLLPTILSRCQHIRFDPLREVDISEALQQRKGLPAAEARIIAQLARGSYLLASEMTGSSVAERRLEAVGFLRLALYLPRPDLLAEIERLSTSYPRTEMEAFLMLLQSWLHDAMLVHEGLETAAYESEALGKFVRHHTAAEYVHAIGSIDRAISLLNKNVYIPLILIQLAITLQKNIFGSSLKTRGAALETSV